MEVYRVVLRCIAKSEFTAEDGNPCRIADDGAIQKCFAGEWKNYRDKRKDR